MTISGESIRKIEFREGWRGYNQVDVDVFLEEIAAGVDELQASLTEAKARAERAESRVTTPGVDHPGADAGSDSANRAVATISAG